VAMNLEEAKESIKVTNAPRMTVKDL